MKKPIFIPIAITGLVVIVLSFAWEFWLEPVLVPGSHETMEMKLEFCATNMAFVFIALAISTLVASRAESSRMLSEKALQDSESKYRDLVETSQNLIWRCDEQGRYIYLNPAWETVFGYKLEEMIGRNFTDFKSPSVATEDMDSYQIHLKKDTGYFGFESIFVSKEGMEVCLLLNARRVKDHAGNVIGMQGTALDITSRRKAEAEIMAAKERAEEATRLKDKFVSIVAHDMKSPLAGIISSLIFLLRDPEALPRGESRELAERSVMTGRRVVAMIDSLLAPEMFKSGYIKTARRFLDAFESSAVALEIHERQARGKGVALENGVKPGTWIYTDPALLNVVLVNLVQNGIKFCANGDKVSIFQPDGREGVLVVQDTGTGFDKSSLLNSVLEALPKSSLGTEGELGTGLGLGICLEVVEVLGGSLEIESEKGEGSSFIISFPPARPRVFITGNEDRAWQKDHRMLHGLTAEVFHVISAKDADEPAIKAAPHIILVDLCGEEKEGIEFIKRLKKIKNLASVPVITVCARGGSDILKEAYSLGAADVITGQDANNIMSRKISGLIFHDV